MEAAVADGVLVVAPEDPAADPEREQTQWFASVGADLRKASDAYRQALAKEAEAHLAVLIAEVEVEAAMEAANAHSVRLKQQHTEAVGLVNESEAAVSDAIAEIARRKSAALDDDDGAPTASDDALKGFGKLVDAYRQSLESRSKVLYVCHTETLASRQALGHATRTRDACKAHLVAVVKERNVLEDEIVRIHTLYADKHNDPEELLKAQLARVRCAADAPADAPAAQCAPTPFRKLLVANAALFASCR